jgi:hypothetical protein
MTKLQNTVNFPLWVGIPQCPNDTAAIPGALKRGIKRINETMIDMGMKSVNTFYGGHSLGIQFYFILILLLFRHDSK